METNKLESVPTVKRFIQRSTQDSQAFRGEEVWNVSRIN